MWDMITMVPTIFSVVNAVDWTLVFGGLWLTSEALAQIPWLKANSVFQVVQGFLSKYRRP